MFGLVNCLLLYFGALAAWAVSFFIAKKETKNASLNEDIPLGRSLSVLRASFVPTSSGTNATMYLRSLYLHLDLVISVPSSDSAKAELYREVWVLKI